MKLKSAYDNFDEASNETGLECKDPTLTQQHDEHDANINNIVKMHLGGQQIPGHNLPPLEGDFSIAPDMQTAMNLGIEAREAFMEHPAEVRARFHNNAAEFVQFCSDPDNMDEMEKLGLLQDEANKRRIAKRASEELRREQDRKDAEAYRTLQKAPKGGQ